jgi:glutamate/tyrosine decarboxylase-like PLP-dependent enzyme
MAYADSDELARILKIRNPSSDQTNAMERVLDAATAEIDAEIDLDADTALDSAQTAIAEQVCLQRAAELWHLTEVPLGIAGIGSDMGATHLARDSWAKYVPMLAPLKDQWGFA